MREPQALITPAQLHATLGQADLRIYDCTTYNEPVPPGSDVPYVAVPGDKTFEAGHIPGADFLDLQGEFSDASAQQFFMMPDRGPAGSRLRPPRPRCIQVRRALQHRHHDVVDAVLVDAALARRRRAGARRRPRRMDGPGTADRMGRHRPRAIRHDLQGHAARRLLRRQECGAGTSSAIPRLLSSTRSVHNFIAASSRAATGGPAVFPAASTFPRQRCVDADKTLTTLADAEAKFAAAGVTRDKNVICYCGGGISATIDLLLLTQLGYDKLTLYDASMGEWARDPALPIRDRSDAGARSEAGTA